MVFLVDWVLDHGWFVAKGLAPAVLVDVLP